MPATSYRYNVVADTRGRDVHVANLATEIAAAIATALSVPPVADGDDVYLTFVSALSPAEETALSVVLAAHVGNNPPAFNPAVITADGSQPFTADLPMGGNMITGLPETLPPAGGLGQALSAGQFNAGVTTYLYNFGLEAFDYASSAALPAHGKVGVVLTASVNGALTYDGVAMAGGELVFNKNEPDQTHNGLATITDAGSPSTPWVITLHDSGPDYTLPVFKGMLVKVSSGNANSGKWFRVTAGGVAGTASIAAEQAIPDAAQLAAIIAAQADIDAHEADTANPHAVTAAQAGADAAGAGAGGGGGAGSGGGPPP